MYVWQSPVTKTKSIHAQGVDDDFDTQKFCLDYRITGKKTLFIADINAKNDDIYVRC